MKTLIFFPKWTSLILHAIINLLFINSANCQSLLTDTANIKYYSEGNHPGNNWKINDFDETDWNIGRDIIAYGDSATTEISSTQTLYIRTSVNIQDKSAINELVFMCDFDDGFVAYANGEEFARVNMGAFNSETSYEQLSDRSHEMRVIHNADKPVLGYYIDREFIDNYLNNGNNIISVEIHNDSINGSDLGFWGGIVIDITSAPWNLWGDYYRYKKCTELDSSNLPIIKIETDEFGVPTEWDENGRIETEAKIQVLNKLNAYNKPSDTLYEHIGNVSINLRGASSVDFQKRQYSIELHDEEYNDTSVSLLGMPREADWKLIGPFADKSQIRNAMAFEWGRKTGHWAPRLKFCELILNGECVGLYNLVEKIKRDSNRVNIAKLRPEETSGTDLTGGYIVRFNGWGDELEIVYPKQKNLQTQQEDYIKDFYAEYLQVLGSKDAFDPLNGYKKYIDEQSLIDYAIVTELTRSVDAYYRSAYMYKDKEDRDPRLKFGPLWDFDLSMGNSNFQQAASPEGWQFKEDYSNNFKIDLLVKDTSFAAQFNIRWFGLREGFLHNDSIMNRMDDMLAFLEKPIERNYEVWPVINKRIFSPHYNVDSYSEEIDRLKQWIQDRVAWIDDNIPKIGNTSVNIEDKLTLNNGVFISLYPNPVSNTINIEMNIKETGNLNIQLINTLGQQFTLDDQNCNQGKYQKSWSIEQLGIKPGIYYCAIAQNNKHRNILKLVVQ